MSTDYFLFSPSKKRAAMVGSIGLSGVQTFPSDPEALAFLRWAIVANITDVVLVNEHDPRLENLDES